MEEKERYELNDNDCIIDNEEDVAICDVCDVSESPETLVDLLNQQDKRIKELEQDETKVMDLLNSMTENWWILYEKNKKLRQENKRLKQQLETFAHRISDQNEEILDLNQQLNDLPKKIVEEIQENFDWKQCCEIRKYYDQQYIWFNYVAFNDFLDTILKKYGGKDE